MKNISLVIILLSLGLFMFSSCGDESNSEKTETETPSDAQVNDQGASAHSMGAGNEVEVNENDKTFQVVNRSDIDKNILKGNFVYFADAALFYPCDDSDNAIPVQMNGPYKLLEKAYMNMNGLEPQEKVYIEVKGELLMADAVESTRKELKLVIDKLVKMNVNMDCDN